MHRHPDAADDAELIAHVRYQREQQVQRLLPFRYDSEHFNVLYTQCYKHIFDVVLLYYDPTDKERNDHNDGEKLSIHLTVTVIFGIQIGKKTL